MKSILTSIAVLLCSLYAYAQTPIKREFDVTGVTEVNFNFKFPELIQLKSWDGDKILIKGLAMVNMGENDGNFEINSEKNSGRLVITSQIRDLDNIPRKRWAKDEDGTIHIFNDTEWDGPEVQKYIAEHPRHHSISNGVIKEIKLEVFIPKNIAVNINCKFGLLEVKDFDAPLNANSKFGGIDISFSPRNKADIEAKTKFGEVYTNLDLDFNDHGKSKVEQYKWFAVRSKMNGGGKRYILESKHGDLFLRKK